MAIAAVQTTMALEDKKSIHPFFAKPQKDRSPEPAAAAAPKKAPADSPHDDADYAQPDAGAKTRKPRAKKAATVKGNKEPRRMNGSQASLESFARPAKGLDDAEGAGAPCNPELEVAGAPALEEEATVEEDPNTARRKRRKTTSPARLLADQAVQESGPVPEIAGMDWLSQLQLEAQKKFQPGPTEAKATTIEPLMASAPLNDDLGNTTHDALPEAGPCEAANVGAPAKPAPETVDENKLCETVKQSTPKKKVLKVNKSGKLISPSSVKSQPEAAVSPPKRKRGRPPKAKASLRVVVKYGSDIDNRRVIGQKIDDILSGRVAQALRPATPKKASPKKASPKKTPPKPAGPPKSTHPFFMGKAAQKESIQPKGDVPAPLTPNTPKTKAVTPSKLRALTQTNQSPRPMPAFGPIFTDNRAIKLPGMIEAPWPTKDWAHVRNIEHGETPDIPSTSDTTASLLKPRKFKRTPVHVSQNEDLIFRIAKQLDFTTRITNEDDFPDNRHIEALRLPERLLTTGIDIQDRVRRELSGKDEHVHPAIDTLFQSIEHSLTPFDKGDCEVQSWVQKYAPVSASEVLQSGKEALVLRDWLQKLTVMAVQGTTKASLENSTSEARKPPKKRRKKDDDDFIVSDDYEEEEFMDISDGEYSQTGGNTSRQRSTMRPRMSRDKNVVIISGPNGCGKSATVYAVAKELGFEVFEINSGSRRSAKDIQDKVGDMSENHLVHQQRDNAKTTQETLAAEHADDDLMSQAFQDDLKSGRQGTMTAFFKSSAPAKTKAKAKVEAKEPQKVKTTAQSTLLPTCQKPRNLQKQSLILFEEADVLFEEDQQFWLQVTKLASQSKRPIIVTCNDESLIPVHDLPFAAILRLAPPPIALATDYLLTLAAKEGHILQRKAVSDLYKSKGQDLRGSIAELDFWCQISVGDRKGGLEWMYQRWPPGKDVDSHGRTLRVASQGTYQSGMGMICHDLLAHGDRPGFGKEEELLKDIWADWGIAPDTWKCDMNPSAQSTAYPPSSTANLAELDRLGEMLDAASSADIYCRVGLPSYRKYYEEPTDPTLPPVSDKERTNYTVDAPFLQVDHVLDYSAFDTDMAVQSHVCIQRAFGDRQALGEHAQLSPVSGSDSLYAQRILEQKSDQTQRQLSWPDFSNVFDIIAAPPGSVVPTSTCYPMTATSFDRTFKIVVEDLAPFVRSIVAHELRLEAQRVRMSHFLSEGGRSKRARTTRASRVALEGGTRQSKRRERWFDKDLNRRLVMATAGASWSGLGSVTEDTEMSSRTGDSLAGTQE